MSKLYQLLQQDAVILENSIVKVDSFLNHQMNIELFEEIRDQFYEYFNDKKIDKIISSSIFVPDLYLYPIHPVGKARVILKD